MNVTTKKPEADVCLLLEGTYPFVRGGVSSWVHQLLTGMPELTFSLVFLGGRRRDYGKPKYELPQNVVHLETHYLEDGLRHDPPKRTNPSSQLARETEQLHEYLEARAGRTHAPSAAVARLEHAVDAALVRMERPGGLKLEHLFTRFIADRDYLGERDLTVPNLFGAVAFTSVTTAVVALALSPLFAREPLFLKLLLAISLITLSDIWIVIVVLTGLRAHDKVLFSFILGYAVTLGATLLLTRFGEAGMLGGFALGQAALLFSALAMIVRTLPSRTPVSFRFLRRRSLFFELGTIGLLYNLGVWIDKWMFWANPSTSRAVLGPFRSSEVYDLPIFLAYLTLVPGMAVFLVRVETDFAETHAAFYGAVRHRASLRRIQQLCSEMTDSARRAVLGIMKVQGASFILAVCLGPWLLQLFGISVLHLPLFYIDAAGVALQVLLLSVTSMFFYLDRRRAVSVLVVLLVVSNATLTWVSQQLGPAYYGYGFAVAMAITSLIGLWLLSRVFSTLVRDTFMLQRSAG